MRTAQIRSLCSQVGFTVAFLLLYSSHLASQVDCKAVRKATEAVFGRTLNIPTHVYDTSKFGNHTLEIEMIYVDGSLYTKGHGDWTLDNSTLKRSEEWAAHKPKFKDTCRYLGDETVNGEMTAKYNLHTEARKSTTDELVWISKVRGLVLREEQDWGDGHVRIVRFEYDNVKPPL
jgi:hypothetical protein